MATSVEHVGSTSVPGLAAKPIIDISVVVPTATDIPTAITRLAAIGYVQPCKRVDGKRVPDGPEERIYPPVIDEALFERVQIVLSGRKGRKGAGRKDGFVNLFSGLCRCEVCKKGVVIRRQKGKTYLVCELARHGSCANR